MLTIVSNADLNGVIGDYVSNMTQVVQAVYNVTIGSVTGKDYISFVDNSAGLENYDSSQAKKNWASNLVDNVSGVFFMRAIKYETQGGGFLNGLMLTE